MTKTDKQDVIAKLVDFANRLGYSVDLESSMPEMVEEAKEKGKFVKYVDGQGKTLKVESVFDEDGNMVHECRPAGLCIYSNKQIQIREGKKLSGKIATLAHEISHALLLGGNSWYSYLGERYVELAAESVTQIVTQGLGIDRTVQTASRIAGYGFTGYLVNPVTVTISRIILDELV